MKTLPILDFLCKFVYFCFGVKPANSKFATKSAKKKKLWILSFLTVKLPEEAEKIENFPKFQRWMKKTNILEACLLSWRSGNFWCRNWNRHHRVPYNKLLTNLACLGSTREYWPSIIFVRTSLHSVSTLTTLGQYSPVWPSRSVSKRLVKIV